LDIKLLVLDIDGTIAGKSNEVSETVKEAIQAVQAKGIQVAIATGRMYCSALRFHALVGSQLPLVAYNGAWIQNPLTQEMVQHLPVSGELALQLLEYFESQPDFEVYLYIGDRLYVRQITSHVERYARRSEVEPITVKDLREILTAESTKVLSVSLEPKTIKKVVGDLRQRFSPLEIHLTQSTINYLEATHPHANKGIAIRYLAENILGFKAENVMAIGDHYNDVEMLAYAGLSIAMGSAPQAVQDIVKWVAPDVEQEGVAVAIKKFLF
jgi:Cof subfamily protein (haloacid dehalogenase superfamily)